MSQVYGNCMNCWLPSGIDSMLEPMHADRKTSKTTYVNNRFHPYSSDTIYRKKYAYESFLNSRFYHGIDSNTRESTEGSYLLPSGGHGLFSGPSLQSSLQRHHASQQTKSQWNFISQNLHALNTDLGTSLQVQSSVSGKDKSHPFYSRVRSEPAEGMTRTRDKYRVVYIEKQRRGLEKEYSTNKFITTEIRARISEELGLSSRQIKIWFQNRRAKERRDIRKNKCSENIQNDGAKDTISNEYSNSNNANDFLTSCRFNGNDHSPEQSPSFNERCQFSNYTENHEINPSSSSFSEDCFLESRACIDVRASVSPSGLYQFTGKSYLPAVDVSPLTGNKDFGFDRRF